MCSLIEYHLGTAVHNVTMRGIALHVIMGCFRISFKFVFCVSLTVQYISDAIFTFINVKYNLDILAKIKITCIHWKHPHTCNMHTLWNLWQPINVWSCLLFSWITSPLTLSFFTSLETFCFCGESLTIWMNWLSLGYVVVDLCGEDCPKEFSSQGRSITSWWWNIVHKWHECCWIATSSSYKPVEFRCCK